METRSRQKAVKRPRKDDRMDSKLSCTAKSPDGDEMLCIVHRISQNSYSIDIKEVGDLSNGTYLGGLQIVFCYCLIVLSYF